MRLSPSLGRDLLVVLTPHSEVAELVHTAGSHRNPGGHADLDPSAVSCRWGPWSCHCSSSFSTSSCASRPSTKQPLWNAAAALPAARLLWCRARPAYRSLAAAGGRRKSTRDVCPPKGQRWGDIWGDWGCGGLMPLARAEKRGQCKTR